MWTSLDAFKSLFKMCLTDSFQDIYFPFSWYRRFFLYFLFYSLSLKKWGFMCWRGWFGNRFQTRVLAAFFIQTYGTRIVYVLSNVHISIAFSRRAYLCKHLSPLDATYTWQTVMLISLQGPCPLFSHAWQKLAFLPFENILSLYLILHIVAYSWF